MYQTIDERLTIADVAIGNVLDDPLLAAALSEFGYDESRMAEGQELLDTARSLHRSRSKNYGRQQEASEKLREAVDHANSLYIQHVKLARLALRDDPGLARSLGLIGSRKQSLSGWMEQAGTFYDNALSTPEVTAALERFNVTVDDLTEGQTRVLAVSALNRAQEKEKGIAQRKTAQRDAAMDALDTWMSEFRAVARIALAEDPQQLEKLQIVA